MPGFTRTNYRVTSGEIEDGAITTAKIANSAVARDHIIASAVTLDNLVAIGSFNTSATNSGIASVSAHGLLTAPSVAYGMHIAAAGGQGKRTLDLLSMDGTSIEFLVASNVTTTAAGAVMSSISTNFVWAANI